MLNPAGKLEFSEKVNGKTVVHHGSYDIDPVVETVITPTPPVVYLIIETVDTPAPPVGIAAVPEPGSIALLATALAVIALAVRLLAARIWRPVLNFLPSWIHRAE